MSEHAQEDNVTHHAHSGEVRIDLHIHQPDDSFSAPPPLGFARSTTPSHPRGGGSGGGYVGRGFFWPDWLGELLGAAVALTALALVGIGLYALVDEVWGNTQPAPPPKAAPAPKPLTVADVLRPAAVSIRTSCASAA